MKNTQINKLFAEISKYPPDVRKLILQNLLKAATRKLATNPSYLEMKKAQQPVKKASYLLEGLRELQKKHSEEEPARRAARITSGPNKNYQQPRHNIDHPLD